MRILIATDAWRPQVNGVVHTLEATAQAADALGAKVAFLTPEGFPSVALPSYPGIRVALPNIREIARRIAGSAFTLLRKSAIEQRPGSDADRVPGAGWRRRAPARILPK